MARASSVGTKIVVASTAIVASLFTPYRAHAQQTVTPSDTTVASPISLIGGTVPLRIHIGGLLQTELRDFLHDGAHLYTNDLVLRRARIDINGTVANDVDFRILPDFGLGSTVIQDAWIDVHYHTDAIRLQLGKFKEPVGLELIQYDPEMFFVERSLVTDLVPNRDVGAQLHGIIGRGTLTWNAGVFDGVPDGGSTDRAVGNNKDLSGRVLVRPFALSSLPALSEFAVGAGGTTGRKVGTSASTLLPTFNSSGQETVFFSYLKGPTKPDTAIANGQASRATFNGYYYFNRLGLLSEYASSWQTVTRDARTAALRNNAWQAAGSIALTNDHPSYTGVSPRYPFDPAKGHWGAVEILGRYSLLQVDKAAFADKFADSTKSAYQASATALGVNWTWNRAVRYQVNYERTFFRGGAVGGNREPENALLAEAQLVF
jgi:phosphate-selective porin OprO and OprP